MRALVLDQDYQPINLADWKRVFKYLAKDKVEILEEYEDVLIPSGEGDNLLPCVVRFMQSIPNMGRVRFSRINLYWRDQFQCQYCGKKFQDLDQLTKDHILPKSVMKAKKIRINPWKNMVTCCKKCNQKKRDRTPAEAGMKLLKKPTVPKWTPSFVVKLKDDSPDKWKKYIY